MHCINCHAVVKLDESLTAKYPEWKCLSSPTKRRGPPGMTLAGRHHPPGSSPSLRAGGRVTFSRMSSNQSTGISRQVSSDNDREENNHDGNSDTASALSEEFSVIHNPAPPASTPNLGHFTTMTGNLFDIIQSDETAIDHPMCQECTDKLLDAMDAQLTMLEDECTEYRTLLERLEQCEEELDLDCLKAELEKLKIEEASLKCELARLESEETQLEKQLGKEEESLNEVKAKDEQLWYSYRDQARQLIDSDLEQSSLQNRLDYAEVQLDKLQRTNIFNLCFHIWHSGHFGTINGLRLGRLPGVTVEWPEINAAWGQTVLLLVSLARKMNLTFQRYVLVPYGNHSYVKCLDDDRELPLYCTGGYKFFWDTKFDAAMVAFLNCLEQLKSAIEKGDNQFCMPYRISGDKIVVQDEPRWSEYSVKIQFNSEERWTKAMKCMLTNLKWALAWVSSLQS